MLAQSGALSGSTAKINQDRGMISYPFCGDTQQMLLAVYDGHGVHGELVSEYASFTYAELLEADESLQSDTIECMRRNMASSHPRLAPAARRPPPAACRSNLPLEPASRSRLGGGLARARPR